MKGNSNVHASLLAVVGGYLLYLAWQQLDSLRKGTAEMSPALSIAVIILFTFGGLGTLWYAWTVYRQGKKADEEENEQERKE